MQLSYICEITLKPTVCDSLKWSVKINELKASDKSENDKAYKVNNLQIIKSIFP